MSADNININSRNMSNSNNNNNNHNGGRRGGGRRNGGGRNGGGRNQAVVTSRRRHQGPRTMDAFGTQVRVIGTQQRQVETNCTHISTSAFVVYNQNGRGAELWFKQDTRTTLMTKAADYNGDTTGLAPLALAKDIVKYASEPTDAISLLLKNQEEASVQARVKSKFDQTAVAWGK